MLWAADRKTKRVEDRAYSLLGLFGVYMPMIYGEGKNALRRLQLEIIRTSDDQSIFSWDPDWSSGCLGSVLANDLSYFRHSGRMIRNVNPTEFICEILKLKFLLPESAHFPVSIIYHHQFWRHTDMVGNPMLSQLSMATPSVAGLPSSNHDYFGIIQWQALQG